MREWVAVFRRGIAIDNPLTVLMIGLCATLAVSTKVEGALFMGLAVIFVLGMSSIIVSSIRSLVPEQVRIPVFIVIIASFVTVVDLTLKAFFPDIYLFLGVWIPLIVVNCIILGRAEAFSYHQPVRLAVADGLGMGLGFSVVIVALAAIRELFGSGEIVFLGMRLITFPEWYRPPGVLLLFPGAFIIFGFIIAIAKWYNMRTSGRLIQPDPHCTIKEGSR
ncbi:MAG: electron transport complex subunit RsxE [Coriobacteriia bacterium]|nr:electron transport complex subunit RsxE [Coriobacteriia bacterium]